MRVRGQLTGPHPSVVVRLRVDYVSASLHRWIAPTPRGASWRRAADQPSAGRDAGALCEQGAGAAAFAAGRLVRRASTAASAAAAVITTNTTTARPCRQAKA